MRARLEGLPERQRAADELTLKVQLAEGKVRLLKQKLDEALTRESELQTAGFVKIIDGPGARPVDKNLPLRVALAFALSLILSTGLVLLLGQVDQGVYTPSQAESHCLASLWSPRCRVWRARCSRATAQSSRR
jgi:uncharacterized protein involved in exopolysaccharide biosynthesis